MNPAHGHLLLNHLPVVGAFFGLFLLSVAILRRSAELKKVGLGVFVALALLAIPVYLTGEPAADLVEHLPGISKTMIDRHEEAAEISFVAVIVVGVIAIAGLFLFRRLSNIPGWFTTMILCFSLVVCGLMAWTADLGGQIRHAEIRSAARSSSMEDPKGYIQKKVEPDREHD